MIYYLGIHCPSQLTQTAVPKLIPFHRMSRAKHPPRAVGRWALDSGGFNEIRKFGKYRTHPAVYAAEVRRYQQTVGGMDWAAVQDWPCDPESLAASKRSVREHIHRTVASYLELTKRAPDVPWLPVIQGWTANDYLYCMHLYRVQAGLSFDDPLYVGLGSCAVRQSDDEVRLIMSMFFDGVRWKPHVFGGALTAFDAYGPLIASADSQGWSMEARRRKLRLPGCKHRGYCSNCMRWAEQWYWQVTSRQPGPLTPKHTVFDFVPLPSVYITKPGGTAKSIVVKREDLKITPQHSQTPDLLVRSMHEAA